MEEKKSSDDVVKLLNKLYYKRNRSVGEVLGKGTEKQFKLPLAGVDVNANVVGRVADVTLTQKYRNCYAENLEATYTFPLTASCSVYSVEMKIEDRVVTGQIEERAKARQDYQQAIDDGKRACLVEQERDEIFTINVGNIQPDEEVTIEIRYCETLTYFEDGSTEIRVPLVVAPKYNPGESVAREQVGSGVTLDTDRVQDASRISPPRLVEGFDPETDLNICVSIANTKSKLDHTANIKNLACSQHATKTSFDDGFVEVSLARKTELMNRDFVLRWQLASEKIESAFVSFTNKKKKTQTGMVSLLPPLVDSKEVSGRDVVFLLDRSGSMMGEKMLSAKKACKYLLSSLGPSDRFSINAFDHTMDWFKVGYLTEGMGNMHSASEESVSAGLEFLTQVDAAGGTEIGAALKDAFDQFETLEEVGTKVVVLITDGHIGFESDVLSLVQSKADDIRVFTLGIDSAVNYGFLERISNISGAISSMVNPGDELEKSMRKIARMIGEPVIQNIEITGVNCNVDQSTLTPIMLPDLFAGRSADMFFQFESTGRAKPKILVTGKFKNGESYSKEIVVSRRSVNAVSRLWAKRVISDLEDQYRASYEDQSEIQEAIISLSKEYSVLSRFTAYTVIDEAEISTKDLGLRKAVQPVHTPEGWGATSSGGGIGAIGAFSYGSASQTFGCEQTGNFTAWGGPSPAAPGQSQDPMSGSWGPPASFDQGSWGSAGQQSQGDSAHLLKGPELGDTMNISDQQLDDIFKKSLGVNEPEEPMPKDEEEQDSSIPSWLKFFLKSKQSKPEVETVIAREEVEKLESDETANAELGLLDKLTSIGSKTKPDITRPLLRVIVAMDSFFFTWKKSWTDIENGHLPDLSELEQSFSELNEALEDHPVSFELPKLTTFLNLNYRSFCSYLSAPNHTIPALRALKKQLNSGYDEAYAEAEAVLTRALGKKGAFWQFTV